MKERNSELNELRNSIYFPPFSEISIQGRDSIKFINSLSASSIKDKDIVPIIFLNTDGRFFSLLLLVKESLEHIRLLTHPEKLERVFAYLDFFHIQEDVRFEKYNKPNILIGVVGVAINREPVFFRLEKAQHLKQFSNPDKFKSIRFFTGWLDETLDYDESYIHHLGLERYVSFTKGCFVGQEPVSRMEHKGRANKTARCFFTTEPCKPQDKFQNETAGVTIISAGDTSVSGWYGNFATIKFKSEPVGDFKSEDGRFGSLDLPN